MNNRNFMFLLGAIFVAPYMYPVVAIICGLFCVLYGMWSKHD